MPTVILEEIWHFYSRGTPLETLSLSGLNLKISKGEFLALVGPTGSGKSTVLQHLNGLLLPHRGRVLINGKDTRDKRFRKSLWSLVGLVMQYPERQFFEETVFQEVSFGPRNLGLTDEEIEQRVNEALSMVGLDRKTLWEVSPFALSGGEQRRVALASVLSVKPGVLALDEPTAGVDPAGRKKINEALTRLKAEQGVSIIMSSHNMDDVAKLADRVVVLKEGSIILEGEARQVFYNYPLIEKAGLELPFPSQMARRLNEAGFSAGGRPLTMDEIEDSISDGLSQR